jgi:hypothetical protein
MLLGRHRAGRNRDRRDAGFETHERRTRRIYREGTPCARHERASVPGPAAAECRLRIVGRARRSRLARLNRCAIQRVCPGQRLRPGQRPGHSTPEHRPTVDIRNCRGGLHAVCDLRLVVGRHADDVRLPVAALRLERRELRVDQWRNQLDLRRHERRRRLAAARPRHGNERRGPSKCRLGRDERRDIDDIAD